MSLPARFAVLVTLPLLLAGCLSAVLPGEVAGAEAFSPDGGVLVDLDGAVSASATFDENRVVGPHINVSRRADGSWAGTLKGQAVSVSKNGSHITGSQMSLDVKQDENRINVGGVAGNSTLRISITHKQLEVKTPQYSITIRRTGYDTFGVSRVQLTGLAAQPNPPQPQMALAMLGAF